MKKIITSITVIIIALFATTVFAASPDIQPVGEITSPDAGEVVSGKSGLVTFAAIYTDDDPGGVSWAVREGTCDAGVRTVWGNVDLHNDPYTWDDTSDGKMFESIADVSSWESGDYCFIFNPKEKGDENDVRETQWFIVDNTAPEITLILPDGDTYDSNIPFYATCDETCDYVNFWWRRYDETFNSASKRYHYVHENGTEFNWEIEDPDVAEKWDGTTYYMEDGLYHVYAAGKDMSGNWARTSYHTFVIDRDLDDDGVLNGPDMCENTEDDNLLEELGVNRWIWESPTWNTLTAGSKGKGNGKAKGSDFIFSMEDVRGCGCTQILDWLYENNPEEYGDMLGHYKFGCTKGIIEDFMSLTSQ